MFYTLFADSAKSKSSILFDVTFKITLVFLKCD